jgi:hypothetical protein
VVRSFNLKPEFLQQLEEVKIPLVVDHKKHFKQSDIFVFPDLDPTNGDLKSLEGYMDASRILEESFKYCVIDGESQIGKSTLLSMTHFYLYENGYFPLFLNGRDIKDTDPDKIIRRLFKAQYLDGQQSYDRYLQLPLTSKALLIDDYQDCLFNSATSRKLLEDLKSFFGKIVIMLDAESSSLPSMRSEFHEVDFYSIKPLGFKKRNELIERYQRLKVNPFTTNEEDFMEAVKTSFDNVQAVLGDKLIPSYPVYILSILQAMEYKPLKQNETSFGYCYQTLIHYSLHKAGVENEDIDTYFNVLAELAYYFVNYPEEFVSKPDMTSFYLNYQKLYISPSFDTLLKRLKQSKIIFETEDGFRFGYNYILYFLSAKKIADIIHEPEGKAMVQRLFDEMHIEHNANILVFITHHSKDISFIEQSLLHSMMVLEATAPITLEKKDPFYNEIAEFANNVKNDILETSRNAREERAKMLVKRDEQDRNVERHHQQTPQEEGDYMKEIIMPFQRSFRSIEIVGQIIKNRKGSLPIPRLEEMITEMYTTGFRTIAYMSHLMVSAKSDIIEMIRIETNDSEDGREIEAKIKNMIQMMSFDSCVSVFSKLMHSAGSKDLRTLYNKVAANMDTPAAKLVSFGINSYYGSISPEEVKQLAEEFKGNIVALRLLKGRVKSYVYNRNLNYKIKQKFASNLNMTLSPAAHTTQKPEAEVKKR